MFWLNQPIISTPQKKYKVNCSPWSDSSRKTVSRIEQKEENTTTVGHHIDCWSICCLIPLYGHQLTFSFIHPHKTYNSNWAPYKSKCVLSSYISIHLALLLCILFILDFDTEKGIVKSNTSKEQQQFVRSNRSTEWK